MKLTNEQLDRIAAEYVIGSLKGQGRRRFETMMMESYRVRMAVWSWEQQFAQLAMMIPDQAPADAVWQRIKAQIAASPESVETRTQSDDKPRFADRFMDWIRQPWSMALTASVLLLVGMLYWQSNYPTQAPQQYIAQQYVATFASESAEALWLVNISEDGQLRVTSQGDTLAPESNSYELWLLPADAAAPRSLGLLPATGGRMQVQLDKALASAVAGAAGLAISLEPKGGSPTGAPTGPVLYQAPLLRL